MTHSFTGYLPLDQAVAGVTAGAVSTICMHPLDLIKTRFQIDESSRNQSRRRPFFGGTIKAICGIVNSHGWVGLYRGLTPNLAGSTVSWGLYFYWYSLIQRRMTGDQPMLKLSAFNYLLASAQAGIFKSYAYRIGFSFGLGVITAFFTNPLWVVKTRMCATNWGDQGAYKGLIDGLYQLAKSEGISGYYKGMVPAILGVSHGALQFMAYEELKKWRTRANLKKEQERLDNTDYVLMAGSSKVFASVATYPYQVLRARLQNQKLHSRYEGVIDLLKKIYSSEGLFGYYKGLAPNVLRVLPGTCITFLVYENMSKFFRENPRYEKSM
ncbi:hypothetical protein G9A89_013758 [Geosiphon pyriformis]|nr:hypothetical protein G9A89_013758 [Geosiphon pyriformis]